MKIKITKATPEDFKPYIPKNDEDRFWILQRLIHSDIDFKFDDFYNKFILNLPLQRPNKGNTLLEKNIENVQNKLIESNPIFDSIKKNVLDNHREQLGEFVERKKTTSTELLQLESDREFSNYDYSQFIRTFIENGFKDDYLNPELDIYNHKENIAVVAPYHLVYYNELIEFFTNVRIWYFLNRLEISLDESYQPAKNEIKPDEEEPTEARPKDVRKQETGKGISIKHFYLTYLLDCKAQGNEPEETKQALKRIGEEYHRKGIDKWKPDSFRSHAQKNEIILNKEFLLVDTFGKNWKEIVLSLSRNKDSLEKYINTQYS